MPPVASERWEGIAGELHKYLKTPRTWPDLERWRASNRVGESWIRNALAYLEGKGRAYAVKVAEAEYVWAQVGVVIRKDNYGEKEDRSVPGS